MRLRGACNGDSEWLRLASALHEADKAKAQRQHRHLIEHTVKVRRVASGGAGAAINSRWHSHQPHAASFSPAHAAQSLGLLPPQNTLEAKDNKLKVMEERSSAHILRLNLNPEVLGDTDTDARGQATRGALEQTDAEDAEQEDTEEAEQRAADIAQIAHVVSHIALAEEAHDAHLKPPSPRPPLPLPGPTSPSPARRMHEASVAPNAAPEGGRESTRRASPRSRHAQRQGTVQLSQQSLQCHKVHMRLQLDSLPHPRLSAAPHARLGSLSERLLRPGPYPPPLPRRMSLACMRHARGRSDKKRLAVDAA